MPHHPLTHHPLPPAPAQSYLFQISLHQMFLFQIILFQMSFLFVHSFKFLHHPLPSSFIAPSSIASSSSPILFISNFFTSNVSISNYFISNVSFICPFLQMPHHPLPSSFIAPLSIAPASIASSFSWRGDRICLIGFSQNLPYTISYLVK